jgi:hypothetical protein
MNTKNIVWIGVCVLVFIVGFVLGRSGIETPLNNISDVTTKAIEQSVQQNTEQDTTNDTSSEDSNVQIETTQNSSGGLSEGQRTLLKSFGLNPDEVTLTPSMIACAEAKVGASRVAEIMGGATPSFMEGASLVACYK